MSHQLDRTLSVKLNSDDTRTVSDPNPAHRSRAFRLFGLHSDVKVFERYALLQSRRQFRPFERPRPIRPKRIQAATCSQKPRKEVTERTLDYLHELVELRSTRFIACFGFLIRRQLNEEFMQFL